MEKRRKLCPHCRKYFYKSVNFHQKRFCSERCRNVYFQKKRRAQMKKDGRDLRCLYCGNPIEPLFRRKFCSDKCNRQFSYSLKKNNGVIVSDCCEEEIISKKIDNKVIYVCQKCKKKCNPTTIYAIKK